MLLRYRNFLTLMIIVILYILSLNIANSEISLAPLYKSNSNIIIWNLTTSGNILYNNEIVGFADGAGNITINNNFTVRTNETLIIEPGVEIFFNIKQYFYPYEIGLTIKGKLQVIGTKDSSITFTKGDNENTGIFIKFSDNFNSKKLILKHCRIEYTKIDFYFSSPVISNNVFKNCRISCWNSSPIISNNTIINNTTIFCLNNSNPIINNNTMIGSEKSNSVGIHIQQDSNPIISNNSISKYWQGISISGTNSIIIENNSIFNNSGLGISARSEGILLNNNIFNNGYHGIYCYSTDVKIKNNKIFLNKEDGINCYNSNPIITNNNITKNSGWGIFSSEKRISRISNNIFSYGNYNYNKNGQIIQYWKLIINSNDKNENLITEANISIYDKSDNLITQNNSYLYDLGETFFHYVPEYYIDNNGTLNSFNPYTITISIDKINKTIPLIIEKNKEINITLEAKLIDLKITNIYLRKINNSYIHIEYTIENIGISRICSNIELKIDSDLVYFNNKTCFFPGKFNKLLKSWQIDFGKHLIEVILDVGNHIDETNEENNVYRILIEIFANGSIKYLDVDDYDGDNIEDVEDVDDDNDNYLDLWEKFLKTSSHNPNDIPLDTDSDKKPDGDINNSEPWMDTDDDNDEIPDYWEIKYGFNPLNSSDSELDYDNDGISNKEEFDLNTDPTNPDIPIKTENSNLFLTDIIVIVIFVIIIILLLIIIGYLKLRRKEYNNK